MRRVALTDYGKLELLNFEKAEALQSGTVKVRVKACAVCGSDLALFKGQRSLQEERYFGHEFAGIVTELGDQSLGFTEGMAVASELSRTCGQCLNCLNGMRNYCKSMNEALLPGGFSEETLVLCNKEYSFLSQIPDGIDFEVASLLEPMNCAYRIVQQSDFDPNSSVVILGLGAMGLFSALILRSFGVKSIIGVDKSPLRLEKVRSLNIMEVIDPSSSSWQEQIRTLTSSYGADLIIEATGAIPVLGDAIALVRPGGRIVVASVYHAKAADLELKALMRKELHLVGAKGPYPNLNSDGTSKCVSCLVSLKDELKKLISVYDYKDAKMAFADAMSGKAIKSVIRFD